VTYLLGPARARSGREQTGNPCQIAGRFRFELRQSSPNDRILKISGRAWRKEREKEESLGESATIIIDTRRGLPDAGPSGVQGEMKSQHSRGFVPCKTLLRVLLALCGHSRAD